MAYNFDTTVEEYFESVKSELLENKIEVTEPIKKLVFFIAQTAINPWEGFIFFNDGDEEMHNLPGDMEIGPIHSNLDIPNTVDNKDVLLKTFINKYNLQDTEFEDICRWGTGLSFLKALYYHQFWEQSKSFQFPSSIEVGQPKLYFINEDETLFGSTTVKNPFDYLDRLVGKLKLILSDGAVLYLAELCYAKEENKKWFINLFK